MSEVIKLVTAGYLPVSDESMAQAEKIMADLRRGFLTGFALIAVGPETAGARAGFSGGRMDRMQLLGNLEMMRRAIVDSEIERE